MAPFERFLALPFRRVVWLLPAALACHEAEEWNIHAWEHAQFRNPSEASETALRLVLVLVTLAGIAGTALWCRYAGERAAAIALISGFGVVMGGNAIQHLYWALAWPGYAPGSVASVLLCLPAIALVTTHALRRGLVRWWLPAGLALCWAAMLVAVVRMGRQLPEAILRLQDMGSWLEARLF